MNDLVKKTEPMQVEKQQKFRKSIGALEEALSSFPNAKYGDEGAPLKHTFVPGAYIREITMPAGLILTSKIHKVEHPYFVLRGKCDVVTEEGTQCIEAPYWGITKAGTKRAIHVKEDTVWVTVHSNPSNTQDLEEIEKDVIANSFADLQKFKVLKDSEKHSGIYVICNTTNEKIYIGSTNNTKNRWKVHKHRLRKNIHANQKLQNAWNKYGEEAFSFKLIQNIEKEEDLIEYEQFWMDTTNPFYNICRVAGRTSGVKQSKEQKEATAERMLGNKYAAGGKTIHTQETKDKIAKSLKGKKHSKESYKRQADKIRGRKHTDVAKKNMSEARKRFIKNNPEDNTCFKKKQVAN